MQIVNRSCKAINKLRKLVHKWQPDESSSTIATLHCSCFSSELVGAAIFRSSFASIMAGHDVSPGGASELQPVVDQVLTPYQPEFQHIDEHPVVMLSALEAAVSAVPEMPFQNDDPRFVQLMCDLEAQVRPQAIPFQF